MLAGYILSNQYEIIELEKSMDFVTIYRAIDLSSGVQVIIKELSDRFPTPMIKQQGIDHFQAEAKRYYKMNNPGLPRYKDYLDYGNKRYLILEYEKGQKLKDFIEQSSRFINVKQALRWGISICKTLVYLNNLKPEPLVFKQLNPDNIIIMPDAEIKLFDFLSPTDRNLPNPFVLPPTAFSSPEHYSGTLDCRSDIYSLGAVMFYLLTREEPPFAFMLEDDPLPSIREFNSQVSSEVDLVVRTAMAFNKEERYEFPEDIELVFLTLMSERSFPGKDLAGKGIVEIPLRPEVKPPPEYRQRSFSRKNDFLDKLSREEVIVKKDRDPDPIPVDPHTPPRRRLKLLPSVKVRAGDSEIDNRRGQLRRFKPLSADRPRKKIDQRPSISPQDNILPQDDFLSKYPELKRPEARKKRENMLKRSNQVERLPSGIKVLREKRRMSEEKLEAITDKLKTEIVFSGSLDQEQPDLKQLLLEMKKKKENQKLGSGQNGPMPPSKTSRLTGITSRLAEGSDELEAKSEARFEGLTEGGLPPGFILNGRYKILDLINISSLAIAYKGFDVITENFVMIKQLKDSSANIATRKYKKAPKEYRSVL